MSSTYFLENINASGTSRVEGVATLGNDLVFTNITNDLTIDPQAQTVAGGVAQIPDLAGGSDDVLFAQLPQEIGNKTILSNSTVADASDPTKQAANDLSMAAPSTTSTLEFCQTADRTIKFPDADGTIALNPTAGTPNALVKVNATGDGFDETMILSAAGTDLVGVGIISSNAMTPSDILIGDVGQSVNIVDRLTVAGNTVMEGDLVVNGTTTTVNSENVTVEDNNLLLSSNYTTAVAREGGLTVNYLPISTANITGYGANTISGAGLGLVAGDLIVVSNAPNASNNGIYEVATYADPLITINTSPAFNFLNNVVAPDTAVAGNAVTSVNIAVLQAGSDGIFEVGRGSNVSSIVFEDIATTASSDAWVEVDLQDQTGSVTAATIPYLANSTATVEVVVSARDDAGEFFGGKLIRSFGDDGAGNASALGAGSKDLNASAALSWASGNVANVTQINASAANIEIVLESDASNTDWKVLYRVLAAEASP